MYAYCLICTSFYRSFLVYVYKKPKNLGSEHIQMTLEVLPSFLRRSWMFRCVIDAKHINEQCYKYLALVPSSKL